MGPPNVKITIFLAKKGTSGFQDGANKKELANDQIIITQVIVNEGLKFTIEIVYF